MALGVTLRILLISSRDDCRDALIQALEEKMPGKYQFYWASLPAVAEKRAKQLLPHIILIDDELAGLTASSLVRRLRQQVPNAASIVVVNANNIAEAQRAILEGARAFLVKPLNPDDLDMVIEQITATMEETESETIDILQHIIPKGRALACTAPRGGSGLTTLTVNTAISMRQLSRTSVAIVDADFYSPAVDIALNLHSERTMRDLLPRLSYLDQTILDGAMVRHQSGVSALVNTRPRLKYDPMTLPQVQELTTGIKRFYQWEFIDLRITLGDTTGSFLDSADGIIISFTPDLVALRNMRMAMDVLLARGYEREKIIVVLNRWDMKGGIPIEDIEKRLRITVDFRIPDDLPTATLSLNRGVPVVLGYPRSALAKSYKALARHLLQICDVPHLSHTDEENHIQQILASLRRKAT